MEQMREPLPRRTATSYLPFCCCCGCCFFNKKRTGDDVEAALHSDEEPNFARDNIDAAFHNDGEPDLARDNIEAVFHGDEALNLAKDNLETAFDSDEEPNCARFFSYEELKKATNTFEREIGRGGYGSVYLGELQDEKTVAVKVLNQRTQKTLEQFKTEVKLLSNLRHENLVVFYGCTKPHENLLLLVYEFVPNHTLKYHLHDQRLHFPWPQRVRIAIEIAEGLSHLHSATPPIIHRDVKTENMLIDNNFHIKIADFGLCRILPMDDTDLTTLTPGTAGYQDPEFKRVFRITDKSDVYSFGVVLLELISRKMAVDVNRGIDKIYLDEIALDMIKNNELEQLVDPDIGYSNGDARRIIDLAVKLAFKCLQPTGKERPTMAEVLVTLNEINDEMEDLPFFAEMENEMQLVQEPHGKDDTNESTNELAHIFSFDEVMDATNHLDPSRVIGEGAISSTYLGKLPDGLRVAVKVLYHANPRRLEGFFYEIMVLSRIRHPNLIRLYGCTSPHDEKLVLVYEFVPNGTVEDHVYRNRSVGATRPVLSWSARLKIAIETVEVLQYLHALEPPLLHRDLKTSNILLDDNFNVKVADVAEARLLPPPMGVTKLPQGTMGYRDPEYERKFRLSDKSDIYSFGVVLLELISGEPAIDVRRDPEEIFLVDMALNKIKHKKLDEIVEPKLGYHSDNDVRRMVDSVAELALECLQPRGADRPPSVEVFKVLKRIQDGHD